MLPTSKNINKKALIGAVGAAKQSRINNINFMLRWRTDIKLQPRNSTMINQQEQGVVAKWMQNYAIYKLLQL